MSEPSAPPPEDRGWTYVITQGFLYDVEHHLHDVGA
jgi:hypothetical protein